MNSTEGIRSAIHKLQKGKDVDQQLAVYAGLMSDVAGRLSTVRFAMNYLSFRENVCEARQDTILNSVPENVLWLCDQVIELTDVWLETTGGGRPTAEETEELLRRLQDIREISMDDMRQITYLTDRFTIYEYVLNREEYRFKEGKLPENYSDRNFANELIQYILGNQTEAKKNNDMQMLRTVSVIEQLPLRMTKNKFYQTLHEGLSVYQTSERKAFDDLLDMIRTTAMISDISNVQDQFPAICETIKAVDEEGLKPETEEAFDDALTNVQEGFATLQSTIDLMMSVQELLNDLYVMTDTLALTSENVDPATGNAVDIIIAIQSAFAEEEVGDISDIYGMYESLEGVQEPLYEQLTLCESVYEEFAEAYKDQIDSLGFADDYQVLSRITRLISDSLYAGLEAESGDRETCNAQIIEEGYSALLKDLDAAFSGMDKNMRKAVMAKVLAQLPPFIRTYEQLDSYVMNALSGCDDMAEKLGCIEILEGMMRDE